jgi:hypothetical protein
MSTSWKTIRVFISSTFRDMQAERDHLVRFVFPKLREHLLPRCIHLVDVDLRWGVTSEEDASEVCREIVDECRPRFLCMLGGRYGSVPPGKSRSITDDEIHYGVLDRMMKDRGFVYFFFRENAATAAIVEIIPGEFRESEGSENQIKLAELKQTIIDADLRPFTYPAQWDNESRRLIGLEKFGKRVYDNLLDSMKSDEELQERFQTDIVANLDEFEGENAAMEAFVEERCERFVLGSREKILNDLLAHACAAGGNSYVCLTGAPGSGKSALLAHLSSHSALNSQQSTILIRHFVGASPGSTDVRRTLRRLCHELKAGCPDITAEIPDEPEKLRIAFLDFLRQACVKKHLVIILDAINQFDPMTYSVGLHWLPEELPPNTCVILSTLEGKALEELRRRRFPPVEVELKPLTDGDGKAIIRQFLKRYRKKFEPHQRVMLLNKTDAGIPLYLLTALEELRTLGTYEEITRRIDNLPPTTHELFEWILKRLESDDGFRDVAGRQVGHELVSRFGTLLGASRYGLSQRELFDLLAPGDVKANPPIEPDPQGNVAALLHLLRPYLMHRGELLDFYHNQFRIASREKYLDTENKRKVAHTTLAQFFDQLADPIHDNRFDGPTRALEELPYHLAHAARESELRELFSQLAYLSARVATGQVFKQIADFSLMGSPLHSTLAPWHDLLKKNAQKLTQHPAMLISLANHEGFPEARAQATTVPWRQPWLRTSPEPMPIGDANSTEGVHVKVTGRLDFYGPRVSAIAHQQAIAFCLERLGTIRVYDLNEMRQTDIMLSIRRDRPLVFACAPDASSLAVFYESGNAELFRCILGRNNLPERLDLVTEFGFHLPETEDPIVVWHDHKFWYQSEVDTIAAISVESPRASKETLPHGQSGEISALVLSDRIQLIALRKGANILLLAPYAPPYRRSTLVTSTCACGARNVAAAFTDGAIIVFEVADTLTPSAEVNAGIPRGALGWDGSRLLWMDEKNGFRAWNPNETTLVRGEDNQEIFPQYLHVIPHEWFSLPDGSCLLRTTHGIVSFALMDGGTFTDSRLESLFGGRLWRAVRKRGNDQWLLEKHAYREVLLGREVQGRLYCALDGKENFFAPSGYGPGLVIDLTTHLAIPLQGCPSGLNVAVGDENGGCWLIDRGGDIFYADTAGQCHPAAKIGLRDVHGSQLKNCDEYLIWIGYSSNFFPETGPEPARTFVFFRKTQGSPRILERIGEQLRHPKEGLCLSVCFDQTTGQMVMLWAEPMNGVTTYNLRIGPVKEFVNWQFKEIPVTGLGLATFVDASLSANGRFLGVVNLAGEISCLSIEDGRVLATLVGSVPFTAVAHGAEGSEFWLVEAQTKVYKCIFVEGKS